MKNEVMPDTLSNDIEGILGKEFLQPLALFEEFLLQIGFKRIEGKIYGLLVLSPSALTSEQIEKSLSLSQSAVSNALRTLSHFGAVETRIGPEGRTKFHSAKEDSIEIAATIFRKREQKSIEDFRRMAEKLLKVSESHGDSSDCPRVIRLKSIILTSKLAEAVMKFVIELVELDLENHYASIIEKVPTVLNTLTRSMRPLTQVTKGIGHGIGQILQEIQKQKKISPFRRNS